MVCLVSFPQVVQEQKFGESFNSQWSQKYFDQKLLKSDDVFSSYDR